MKHYQKISSFQILLLNHMDKRCMKLLLQLQRFRLLLKSEKIFITMKAIHNFYQKMIEAKVIMATLLRYQENL
ncbi:hypothetical protein DW846_02395 [Ruminococcus sp. AM36-2AA]|nr:hypothetical protein DW851_02390 [Ruminococcus sp. AM36-5]RGH62466.1 hypothetical protein DW846_02395 [Ruminococcus sp. AM36-2AA]